MMATAIALPAGSGLTSAVCAALSVSRASVLRYRAALAAPPRVRKPRPASLRALPENERNEVLNHLHAPRFADQTPTEVFATLLDEGTYLCSIRTMYRILAAQGEVAARRRQRTHPVYQKPELLSEVHGNPCGPWGGRVGRRNSAVTVEWLVPARGRRNLSGQCKCSASAPMLDVGNDDRQDTSANSWTS